MQFHESLTKILAEKRFVIADYQRPYAWTQKQLTDLWIDLDLLGKGEHYAGTLVLLRTEDPVQTTTAGEDLRAFEVVDGQQRLITITVLLNRLHRRLEALGLTDHEGVVEAVGQLRRLVSVTVAGANRPRLTLSADLDLFWRDHVIGVLPPAKAPLAAEARLLFAARYFDARLDELTVEGNAMQTAERLLDLRRRVTSGLKLLVYEVASNAEVGVIFETLNDRGRPLTSLEKIKNYLLYLASQLDEPRSTDLAERINQRWSGIFRNLADASSEVEDRLLRAHWLTTQNPDRRSWRQADSVKALFPRTKYVPGSQRIESTGAAQQNGPNPEAWQSLFEDVSAYVDTLGQCSAYLADLYDPRPTYAAFAGDPVAQERVRKYSKALFRSGVVAPFLPLLFASRLTAATDAQSYGDLVEACETYAARVFTICARRTGAGQTFLAGAGHRLFKGTSDIDAAVGEVRKRTANYADDERVRKNFADDVDWYSRDSHKYFLYEYELHQRKSEGVLEPFTSFTKEFRKTTEHILPQNPKAGSVWLTAFKDPVERSALTHSIGNLVLTMDNSSYSNKDYGDKRGFGSLPTDKPCYYNAALMSEREIATMYERWEPASVRERLAKLEKWALERWPIPVTVVPDDADDIDDDDRDVEAEEAIETPED